MAASGKKKVLIVNTNGGVHAVIGFYFAKEHLSNGHQVTVLTVGDKVSDKMKKPPSADSRKLFEHLTLSSFQIRAHKTVKFHPSFPSQPLPRRCSTNCLYD